MTISSRTPEGWPNRCSVCGHDFRLEPSPPAWDVPCPRCGALLWSQLQLAKALDQLSGDERTALELRYLHEPRCSLPEIAQHLNRPTAKAVAGLLARALDKLRKLLPDDESGLRNLDGDSP